MTRTSWAEVAVVGGGPAGLATALSLVRHAPELADRVVVLEQSTYPRDKICAGGLGARADRVLCELGVEPKVPSVAIRGISLRVSAGTSTERAATPIGRVVRRRDFDQALADAAVERGVRLLQGARVARVEFGAGGVILETSRGSMRARVVVGADGVGSVVRRAMGVDPAPLHAQTVEVDTPPCESDEPRDVLLFEALDPTVPGYTWDFPTLVDGRPMVCRGAYVLQVGRCVPDVRDVLVNHLAGRGFNAHEMTLKRYAARGFSSRTVLARPHALLVGEAAGVDPVTGEGIPQALSYGELAGRYLATCFADGDWRLQGWDRAVRRAKFGMDLRLRSVIAPRFYGPDRLWLERLLVRRPHFIQCGILFFGGKRVPRRRLAATAWFGLELWLQSVLSRNG